MLNQPIDIPGRPLEPGLGLPQAVFRPRRMTQLLQLGLGILIVGTGAAFVLPTGWHWLGMPLDLVVGAVGVVVVLEALSRMRSSACLVIAAEGFDDRVDGKGPVLWRDVLDIRATRTEPGHIVELHLRIARPDGKAREHVIKVSEVYRDATPVLAAIESSRGRWVERAARG